MNKSKRFKPADDAATAGGKSPKKGTHEKKNYLFKNEQHPVFLLHERLKQEERKTSKDRNKRSVYVNSGIGHPPLDQDIHDDSEFSAIRDELLHEDDVSSLSEDDLHEHPMDNGITEDQYRRYSHHLRLAVPNSLLNNTAQGPLDFNGEKVAQNYATLVGFVLKAASTFSKPKGENYSAGLSNAFIRIGDKILPRVRVFIELISTLDYDPICPDDLDLSVASQNRKNLSLVHLSELYNRKNTAGYVVHILIFDPLMNPGQMFKDVMFDNQFRHGLISKEQREIKKALLTISPKMKDEIIQEKEKDRVVEDTQIDETTGKRVKVQKLKMKSDIIEEWIKRGKEQVCISSSQKSNDLVRAIMSEPHTYYRRIVDLSDISQHIYALYDTLSEACTPSDRMYDSMEKLADDGTYISDHKSPMNPMLFFTFDKSLRILDRLIKEEDKNRRINILQQDPRSYSDPTTGFLMFPYPELCWEINPQDAAPEILYRYRFPWHILVHEKMIYDLESRITIDTRKRASMIKQQQCDSSDDLMAIDDCLNSSGPGDSLSRLLSEEESLMMSTLSPGTVGKSNTSYFSVLPGGSGSNDTSRNRMRVNRRLENDILEAGKKRREEVFKNSRVFEFTKKSRPSAQWTNVMLPLDLQTVSESSPDALCAANSDIFASSSTSASGCDGIKLMERLTEYLHQFGADLGENKDRQLLRVGAIRVDNAITELRKKHVAIIKKINALVDQLPLVTEQELIEQGVEHWDEKQRETYRNKVKADIMYYTYREFCESMDDLLSYDTENLPRPQIGFIQYREERGSMKFFNFHPTFDGTLDRGSIARATDYFFYDAFLSCYNTHTYLDAVFSMRVDAMRRNSNNMPLHMAILGAPGSGKSLLAKEAEKSSICPSITSVDHQSTLANATARADNDNTIEFSDETPQALAVPSSRMNAAQKKERELLKAQLTKGETGYKRNVQDENTGSRTTEQVTVSNNYRSFWLGNLLIPDPEASLIDRYLILYLVEHKRHDVTFGSRVISSMFSQEGDIRANFQREKKDEQFISNLIMGCIDLMGLSSPCLTIFYLVVMKGMEDMQKFIPGVSERSRAILRGDCFAYSYLIRELIDRKISSEVSPFIQRTNRGRNFEVSDFEISRIHDYIAPGLFCTWPTAIRGTVIMFNELNCIRRYELLLMIASVLGGFNRNFYIPAYNKAGIELPDIQTRAKQRKAKPSDPNEQEQYPDFILEFCDLEHKFQLEAERVPYHRFEVIHIPKTADDPRLQYYRGPSDRQQESGFLGSDSFSVNDDTFSGNNDSFTGTESGIGIGIGCTNIQDKTSTPIAASKRRDGGGINKASIPAQSYDQKDNDTGIGCIVNPGIIELPLSSGQFIKEVVRIGKAYYDGLNEDVVRSIFASFNQYGTTKVRAPRFMPYVYTGKTSLRCSRLVFQRESEPIQSTNTYGFSTLSTAGTINNNNNGGMGSLGTGPISYTEEQIISTVMRGDEERVRIPVHYLMSPPAHVLFLAITTAENKFTREQATLLPLSLNGHPDLLHRFNIKPRHVSLVVNNGYNLDPSRAPIINTNNLFNKCNSPVPGKNSINQSELTQKQKFSIEFGTKDPEKELYKEYLRKIHFIPPKNVVLKAFKLQDEEKLNELNPSLDEIYDKTISLLPDAPGNTEKLINALRDNDPLFMDEQRYDGLYPWYFQHIQYYRQYQNTAVRELENYSEQAIHNHQDKKQDIVCEMARLIDNMFKKLWFVKRLAYKERHFFAQLILLFYGEPGPERFTIDNRLPPDLGWLMDSEVGLPYLWLYSFLSHTVDERIDILSGKLSDSHRRTGIMEARTNQDSNLRASRILSVHLFKLYGDILDWNREYSIINRRNACMGFSSSIYDPCSSEFPFLPVEDFYQKNNTRSSSSEGGGGAAIQTFSTPPKSMITHGLNNRAADATRPIFVDTDKQQNNGGSTVLSDAYHLNKRPFSSPDENSLDSDWQRIEEGFLHTPAQNSNVNINPVTVAAPRKTTIKQGVFIQGRGDSSDIYGLESGDQEDYQSMMDCDTQ